MFGAAVCVVAGYPFVVSAAMFEVYSDWLAVDVRCGCVIAFWLLVGLALLALAGCAFQTSASRQFGASASQWWLPV